MGGCRALSQIPLLAGTVIVGMSGGVDSAVAALLLRDAGYSVQGLFMSNWDDDDGYCTTAADFQDARRVCEILGIALHRVSFAEQYRERVFSSFLARIRGRPHAESGRSLQSRNQIRHLPGIHAAPGRRLDRDRPLRAGSTRTGRCPELLKAADAAKDQSYFLHSVAGLRPVEDTFPLGGLQKAQVRAMAHAAGLPVFDKPDSTGICFIGERPFQEFLSQHLRTEPGPIETADGRILGEHRGSRRSIPSASAPA